MTRLKLELPDNFIFESEIPVQIGDINYGGHLSNDAVLKIAHEVRLRWLASFSASEKDVGGVGLLMTDAIILYASQGRHGDRLRIQLGAQVTGKSSFDIFYLMKDGEREVARLKTGMVTFCYDRQKVRALPDDFRRCLNA